MTPPVFPLTAIVVPGAAISLSIAVALLQVGHRNRVLRASLWWALGLVVNAVILAGPIGLGIAHPVEAVMTSSAAPAILFLFGSLRFLHHSALIGVIVAGIVIVVAGLGQGMSSEALKRVLSAALFLAGGLALFANGAISAFHRRRSSTPFALTIAIFLAWGAVRTAEGFYPPADGG
ncbi:MAG: hypothetical protein FJX52_08270, partial [Alphaproteobacteria bacterium]|nr:hypothetical protein [Alphaproteobacteria bacterium]